MFEFVLARVLPVVAILLAAVFFGNAGGLAVTVLMLAGVAVWGLLRRGEAAEPEYDFAD